MRDELHIPDGRDACDACDEDDAGDLFHAVHPYEALGHPIRRRIVDILASGEHSAGEVAALVTVEFRISRTAVSKHLRILRDARLIDVRAEEQWRWYRLAPEGVRLIEEAWCDLREKLDQAIGWDADRGCERDPLAAVTRSRTTARKGVGLHRGAGSRGRQKAPPEIPLPPEEPLPAMEPTFVFPREPREPRDS